MILLAPYLHSFQDTNYSTALTCKNVIPCIGNRLLLPEQTAEGIHCTLVVCTVPLLPVQCPRKVTVPTLGAPYYTVLSVLCHREPLCWTLSKWSTTFMSWKRLQIPQCCLNKVSAKFRRALSFLLTEGHICVFVVMSARQCQQCHIFEGNFVITQIARVLYDFCHMTRWGWLVNNGAKRWNWNKRGHCP